MKVLILILSAVFYSQVHASSEFINHQEEIKKAQDFVNSFNKEYPILIFDRDEVAYLFSQNNLIGDEKEGYRNEFLLEYVAEKTGLKLTTSEVSNLESYAYALTSSAVAVPFFKERVAGKPLESKICIVFPNRPNGNQRSETEHITGMDFVPHKFSGSYDQLNNKMSHRELYLFSMYHEIGHCLDQKFIPEAHQQYSPSAYYIHLGEAFAEVFSYLTLLEEFGEDLAIKRAQIRALYSRVVGSYLPNCKSFGNDALTAGGAIYYLTPYLMDAFEKISMKEIKTSSEALISNALQIVDEIALKPREVNGVKHFLVNGKQKTLDLYLERAKTLPNFFYNTYRAIRDYIMVTDFWLDGAFNMTNILKKSRIENPFVLDKEKLCESLKFNSFEEHKIVLDQIRKELNINGDENIKGDKKILENLLLECNPEYKPDVNPVNNFCEEQQKQIQPYFNRYFK